MKNSQKSKVKSQKSSNTLIDSLLSYGYYVLFFLAPLVMSSKTSELFEFNKMLFIYFIASLVAFLWILKMILAKKIMIKRTPFDLPILLFFLSQVFSTLFSIDQHTSLFGYYSRFNGGLLSIIAYLILFYAFVSNFSSASVFRLLNVSLWSSFVVILWGLPGRFGYDVSCFLFAGQLNNNCWTDQFRPAERMFSTLGQPNWLGAYLAIHFFIALLFFSKKDQDKKIYWLIGFYLALNFASILFTRSRSAFGAVAVGLIFYTLFNLTRFTKKLLLLFFFLAISLLVFKTGIPTIDRYLDYRTYINKSKPIPTNPSSASLSLSNPDITESFDIRKIVWEGAIELGKKYPLFGTGVETFAYSYYFVRPAEHNLTSEWDYLYNKAHNEYLNYLATTGFLGLTTHLLFIILVIFYVFKISHKVQNSKPQFFLLLSYLTILITNFFGFSTTTINLFFYLIPAFLYVLFQSPQEKEDKEVVYQKQSFAGYVLIGGASLFFILTAVYLISYLMADIRYTEATNYTKMGEYQQAAQYLDRAIKFKNEHVYADKLSYVLANLAFIASYQKQLETSSKLMNLANYYSEVSLKSSPKNILYWKTKAKNHYLFYQITLEPKEMEEAIDALVKAREIAPTDPKIPYNLAIFYSLLVDSDKLRSEKTQLEKRSIEEIDAALFLKKNYRDGYFLKAQLMKKYENTSEAKKALEYVIKTLNPRDEEAKKELESL